MEASGAGRRPERGATPIRRLATASAIALMALLGLCVPVDGDFGDPRASPQTRCAHGTPQRGGGQSPGREDVLVLACYLLWTSNSALPLEERLLEIAPYCLALKQWRDGCDARSANPYK